jgi:hypothetical protein
MIKSSHILPSIIITLLFTSCIQEVQTEFPELEREVVVNGVLEADEIAKVHLSWSGGLKQEGVLENIEDAAVILREESTNNIDTLQQAGEGLYLGNFILSSGDTYHLSVQISNHPIIYASDKVPYPSQLSNPEITNANGVLTNGDPIASIQFEINHNQDEENYFFVFFYNIFGSDVRNAIAQPPFDQVIVNEGLAVPLFSNKDMTTNPYKMQLNFSVTGTSCTNSVCVYILQPMLIEFQTLSQNTFQYYKQAYLHEKGRNRSFEQLLPPIINVHSNIENGKGILAAFARYKSDTISPPPMPVF